MQFDPSFQPESEDEFEFMQRLSELRQYGTQIGLSDKELAAALQQASMIVLMDELSSTVPTNEDVCPDCQTPINDLSADAIGADTVVLEPCGHQVEWDDIPKKVLDELYFDK